MNGVSRNAAISNLANVLASLVNFNENDRVELGVFSNKITFLRKAPHKPDPVFDTVKVTTDKLKVGDTTYFDYVDRDRHGRTRRGVVTEVTTDDVLIFDFEAENHTTGERGAFRRSKKSGMSNVYKLTDHLPF